MTNTGQIIGGAGGIGNKLEFDGDGGVGLRINAAYAVNSGSISGGSGGSGDSLVVFGGNGGAGV